MKSSGILLILSSPSGGGKTTIAKSIVKNDPNNKLSISYTTRPKRDGEIDDQDYHFTSKEHFMDLVAKDNFLEYATIYDNLYGTPKDHVIDLINSGHNVIFDIDWQGCRAIKETLPHHAVSIFILPPSIDILKERLIQRHQNSITDIDLRVNEAKLEISHYKEYDYIVMNDNLEDAINKISNILQAEKLKRTRLLDIEKFISSL